MNDSLLRGMATSVAMSPGKLPHSPAAARIVPYRPIRMPPTSLHAARAAPGFFRKPAAAARVPVAVEEDTVLLARLRRGERSAFDELTRRHGPRLLRLAHCLLGYQAGDEAADAVQEVLARLLSRPASIAPRGDLEKWLVTVVLNQCRTQQRRWSTRLKSLTRWPSRPAPAAPAADLETHEHVRHAVGKLPPRDREVIVLHYLEELPVAPIGELLNLSCNAVEVRLHRARRKLKEILTR
jgi:RNA polymerase sigma factor (sigma-70 family)